MKYVITYRIRNADGELRAGARRKEIMRFDAPDHKRATEIFLAYCKISFVPTRLFELSTGDWEHVCLYHGNSEELIEEEEE